jgi:hypothetical protein
VVTRVLHRDDAYPGVAKEEAPDLLLTLRDGGFVSITKSDRILKPRPQVKGTHRPEGVLFARGPGIRAGERLDDASILDVAPTLLYSLDLPVPDDFEGRVLTAAFAREFVAAHPVRACKASGEPYPEHERGPAEAAPEPESLSDGEQNVIIERLKALGYLE